MKEFDVVIIGAGIAGASIASEIGADRSVLLLEAEDQPGYHSTGRSAAFWTETYGGPRVQPLTSASRAFLDEPPADFSPTSFLRPRGAVNIGQDEQGQLAEEFLAEFDGSGLTMERWSWEQATALVPDLKPVWKHAVYEPDCRDIDVAAQTTVDFLFQPSYGLVISRCGLPVLASICIDVVFCTLTASCGFGCPHHIFTTCGQSGLGIFCACCCWCG